jgi:hypothetical protein
MPKRTKSEKKRIPIDFSIVSEDSLSHVSGARENGNGASTVSVYGQLLGERNRYVEARHRAQQRMDQIVAAAAAGALVLSITFLRGIAPAPAAGTAWLLIAGWAALAAALGASLAHHHLGQRAFDAYVRELDRAFGMRDLPGLKGLGAWLPLGASGAFMAGILCLAVFAFANLGLA